MKTKTKIATIFLLYVFSNTKNKVIMISLLLFLFSGTVLGASVFMGDFVNKGNSIEAEVDRGYRPPKIVTRARAEEVNYALPVRIRIPRIDVDAHIEHVGLTSNGEMDVPKELANTAWYKYGPRPGESGSSVIDGHSDSPSGKAGVFHKLAKLRRGDKLHVEDERGMTISFVVRESREYDPKADSTGIFTSNDGLAHLNLITCIGVWDEASKSYSKRLVVFADKE